MSKINCLLKKFSSNCPIFLYTFTFCKIIRQPVVRLWVILLRSLNSVLVFNFVLRLKWNQRRSYARNSLHRRTMFISISNLLPLPLQPAQTLPCRLLRKGIAEANDDQRDDQDCFRLHVAHLSNVASDRLFMQGRFSPTRRPNHLPRLPRCAGEFIKRHILKLILPPFGIVHALTTKVRDKSFCLQKSDILYKNFHATRTQCGITLKTIVFIHLHVSQ